MRCFTARLFMVFFLLLFSSIVYSQGQKNFHFQGSAIVIHGGAGGIEPKYYNEEQIAAYDSALQAVLKEGYGMLSAQANGLDVVVHCLTMLENDPRFNA